MTRHGASPGHGFTLLEVLVALAVLAIALGALVQNAGAGARNGVYLRDRTLAYWVALNQLTEWQLRPEWPGTGHHDGSASMAGQEWFYDTEIKTTPDPDILSIQVVVRTREDSDAPTAARVTGYLGKVR